MKNCVVYVVDNNDLQMKFLRNSLNTLRKNYDGDIHILVDENFEYRDSFRDCSVTTVTEEMRLKYLPNVQEMKRPEITYATFYRFMIPILDVFKKYRQVLYLDNDTEIVRPIDGIFKNEEKEFYGVNEYWLLEEHNRRLGHIKHLDRYCNAGVLLINLFRMEDFERKLSEMNVLQNRYNFKNLDQDMLNLRFDFGLLDRKYNCYPMLEDTSKAVILHYVNSLKNILMKKISYGKQL